MGLTFHTLPEGITPEKILCDAADYWNPDDELTKSIYDDIGWSLQNNAYYVHHYVSVTQDRNNPEALYREPVFCAILLTSHNDQEGMIPMIVYKYVSPGHYEVIDHRWVDIFYHLQINDEYS